MSERFLIVAISLLVLAGAVMSSLRRSVVEAAFVLAVFLIVLLAFVVKSWCNNDKH